MSEANKGKDPNRWRALVSLALVQFMLVVDDTVVNVALPTIQGDLGFDAASLAWVANGYFIFFGGFLLLGGRGADLFGKRRVFLLGLSAFTLASVLNGLATSPSILIGARMLQGLGAALVSPSALALITTLFEDEAERAKAMGVWGALFAFGSSLGVVLGGVITQYLSWRWIFYINVPPAIFALTEIVRLVRPTPPERKGGFDVLGATLVTAASIALIYALLGGEGSGLTAQQRPLLAGAAIVLFILFILVEKRTASPLVPLALFRHPTMAAANIIGLLLTTSFFGMFFLLTFYMQRVLGYTPLQAGLAYLGFSAGVTLGVSAASQLTPRLGMKVVVALGMLVNTGGMFYLSQLPVAGTYWLDVFPRMLMVGLGGGCTFVAVTIAAVSNVDPQSSGLASGVLQACQQVGGAMGLALLVAVSTHYGQLLAGEGLPELAAQVYGHQRAFQVGTGLCLIAVLLALAFIDNLKPGPAPSQAAKAE